MGGSHAPLADLMVAPGEDPATAARLANRISSPGADLADLYGMPGDSRLVAALPTGSLHLLERLEAPVLDLRGGWDASPADVLRPKPVVTARGGGGISRRLEPSRFRSRATARSCASRSRRPSASTRSGGGAAASRPASGPTSGGPSIAQPFVVSPSGEFRGS